jgi:hypothetical protein
VLIMFGRSIRDKQHLLWWKEVIFLLWFFWRVEVLIFTLLWDGKNAQLWRTWSHHFEAYKFFHCMFGFSRMGLSSEIILRGIIKDVMKGCGGFRVISLW